MGGPAMGRRGLTCVRLGSVRLGQWQLGAGSFPGHGLGAVPVLRPLSLRSVRPRPPPLGQRGGRGDVTAPPAGGRVSVRGHCGGAKERGGPALLRRAPPSRTPLLREGLWPFQAGPLPGCHHPSPGRGGGNAGTRVRARGPGRW